MPPIKVDIPPEKLAEICRRYRIKELSLFGSILRDDFGPESDVDVLVVFEPDARVTFLTLGEIQQAFSKLLKRPVDVVPKDGLKSVIRDDVLARSQVIYAN